MATPQGDKSNYASLQSALYSRDLSIEDFVSDEPLESPELSEIVRGVFSSSEEYKLRFLVQKWTRALYFYLGYQHMQWVGGKRRWYPVLLGEDNRKTVNLCRSRVLTTVAALIREDPGWEIIPRGESAEAREEARVNEKILRYMHDEGEVGTERVLMAFHQAIFGGVFGRIIYDSEWGERVWEPKMAKNILTGQPVLGPDGQPVMLTDKRGNPIGEYAPPPGIVRLEMRSVFEVHKPPTARIPKTSRLQWIGEKRAVPVDEIYSRYGLRVKPDKSAIDITQRISTDVGRFFDPSAGQGQSIEAMDCAFVHELHCAASSVEGFEEGRKVVVIDKWVVENGPGELRAGRLPYEYFPCLPVPLRFDADTPLDDMLEPQNDYNRAAGHMAVARSRFAFPYVVIERGSVARDDITGGGRVLEKQPGTADPSFPDAMRLNAAAVADMQRSKGDVDETAGQHTFSRGQMQGSSPQPVGTIQAMLDADMSDLQPGMKLSNAAFARCGENMLEMGADHYDTERVASVVDESDDVEVFRFTKTDITPGLKVMVKKASQLPIIKDSMRTQLVEMAKSGILGPMMQDPTFIAWFTELFDMPAPSSFLALTPLDLVRQEREITKIVRGEQVEVGPFDDHDTHLKVIARFTKTGKWDRLAPDQRQAVMAHAQAHKDALAPPPQMPMPGAPAQPGGPAGPMTPEPPPPGLDPKAQLLPTMPVPQG